MGKNKNPKGWHPADIKAALAKKGYSFARIAREHGYGDNSPNAVLRRPWAPMEEIVAGIIGVAPQTIWPHRYRADRVIRGQRVRRTISQSRNR